jgi:L-lactate dehydrogenase complex protein LldG
LFLEMAAAADAEVMRVADLHGVPQQVARFLAANHLGREVTAVPHPLVARVPWRLQSPVTVREVQALPDWRRAEDRPPWVASGAGTTLSVAWAAVAETGTVVMRSGREAPASLNFLGENHIVLVEQTVIVPNYEDVWMRLRRESGGDVGAFMPRAVHFITGPSRSADIEQTIQLGAHGPRRLFIVVIDDVGQG